MSFNKRFLRYETNAKNSYLDYGEVKQVINDKIINVQMGGSAYVLEAITIEGDYIPKIGDWVTIEWRNGSPIAKGGSGISTGLRDINDNVKIVSPGDLAGGTVNSDHIRTNTIEARHISANSIQADHISANQIKANHIDVNTINAGHISANAITADKIKSNEIEARHIKADQIQAQHISANSITAEKIAAGEIEAKHIKAGTISAGHISANAITAVHISASAIEAQHISANSIQTQHISANSIKTQHIEAGTISAVNIGAQQIQAQHISANSISTEHIKTGTIEARHISANSIQAQHISSNSISANHIGANAIVTAHISANQVVSSHIKAGSIQATHISANSVNATHILANAVQAQHISANSIKSTHISANAIQAQHISANSISSNHITSTAIAGYHIVSYAIEANHISANSINTGHIVANAIQANHIAADAIETRHIKADQIEAKHIKASSIIASHISANAVQAQHISANTLNATHIKTDAIEARHISANSISGNHIQANAISAGHIKADNVNATHITANAINATHISANAVQANHISANSVQTQHISADSVRANHISANNVQAKHISANSVQAQHISANSVQASHISANSITTTHISANTITGAQIKANQISGNHVVAGTIDTDHLTVGTRKEGLLGQYYTYDPANGSSKFQVYKGHQIDPTINFAWGTGSPSLVGQADNFAVRWQGFIFAPQTGQFTFHATADDAIKVVINNTVVINQTAYANGVEQNGTISLAKDNWYPILVEVFEGTSSASAVLKWTLPSALKEVIPSKYYSQANTVIDGATITTGSITTTHIKTGTITADSGIIADLAIQTAHIALGAITSAKIGNAEIKTANIASGNITNAHIADATITSAKIKSVNADTIQTGTLNANLIAAGTIKGSHIEGDSITGSHIKANSVDTLHLKAGSISSLEIQAGAITASKLEVGSVTADTIRAGTIQAYHISTVGLDAQEIRLYNGASGETLIGEGFLRVDGLDVGVVRSDNLLANGLFMTASSSFGILRDNNAGDTIVGARSVGAGGHKIWKIDLATGQKVAEIDVAGKKPYDIAIHPTGNHAYVTVQGDNTVMQIDLANDIAGTVLNVPQGPARIKWTGDYLQDHKHFFVLNTDPQDQNIPDALTIIDAPPESTNQDLYLHHNIILGNNPVDMVMSNDRKVYITMGTQGDIVVVDLGYNSDSPHNSVDWRVVGRIPITAYATDVYHGGVDGTFGLNSVTGGDASSQYNKGGAGHSHSAHAHGGYGTPDGTIKDYEARGIANSSDPDTLYVVDKTNGELVVVDKYGYAPYNELTGSTMAGTIVNEGHAGHEMPPVSGGATAPSPEDFRNAGEVHGGGPGNYYVRYRIPVGDNPEFVEVCNGKIFVTVQGANQLAIIDEQQILNEIQADRAYYGYNPYPFNPFLPMRAVGTITVRSKDIGARPTFIKNNGGQLFITLSGQNQVVTYDTTNEVILSRYNTGANPRGFAVTPDGKHMYVANHGGVGDMSFIYGQGPYIGDAFFGLEGGIVYQGAEYWTPDRSNWTYDTSGNIKSYATVEFRVNEPFLNEGGYAKLSAYGNDYQYSLIEQDIYNVTNYSNGNNTVSYTAQRLVVGNSGNTIFYPAQNEWNPTPSNIKIIEMVSGSRVVTTPASNKYSIFYGESSRIEFVSGTVNSNQWVEANYTSRFNQYFAPHNGSMLIAVENGSSPNFNTVFEIDEFVPKFVVYDNLQTNPFTPTADGVNETYTGLEYSVTTDRASGRSTITSSVAPTTGVLKNITDGDHMTTVTLPSGLQYVQIDLGKKYMIGRIDVVHKHEMVELQTKFKNTKTQVSADGVTWVTVYDSAVSGEYYEYAYHPVHDHYHMGKPIIFNAMPVRYVRDYANGWVDSVAGTSGTTSQWSEINVFGDWEIEEGYKFPTNSEKAGQNVATNGKSFVSTDISKAYIAFDIAIEFTSWWYMTYIVGPNFGEMAVEMSTVMGGSHFLDQSSMYINNIPHRHIMAFPPSLNVKEDIDNSIKAGMHRVILRQESGRVTLDRIRVEDFQYFNRNSTIIPSTSSSTTFRRYRKVAEQAKWYQGVGRQATEGAYDMPRTNPDSGLPDKSVPIKYRVRVRSELDANGTIEERGIAYITSAIFETGKQSTHWRPSAASDSYPGSKIEFWDANQPHKTGIQSHHIAHGSIKGPKIMTGAIMDYHVSNYAKIGEHKLALRHPTHRHGKTVILVGQGPMGTDLPVFVSNKDFLDSLDGFGGISGNYGTGNTVARADHKHDYLPLVGGTVTNALTINNTAYDSHLKMARTVSGTTYAFNLTPSTDGGIDFVANGASTFFDFNKAVNVSGNINLTGTVNGVDIAGLNTSFNNHNGSGNTAHAVATTTVAGFMSGADKTKLNGIATSANNYSHPTGDGNLHVPVTSTTNNGKVLKAGATAGSISWGSVDWSEVINKPTTFTPATHTHADATQTVAGFFGTVDKTKLDGIAVSANNYVHPTGAGNNHIPTGGAAGNFLKYSASGVAVWSTPAWADIASKPTTFAPSAHTHTASEITDLSTNYYNKTEVGNMVANAGDIKAGQSNVFTNLNTFNNAGMAIKIQPSVAQTPTTKLIQINQTTGTELFSVNYSGGVFINGDFTVTGVQTYSGTTTVDGDYTVNGQLIAKGNTTLGDASTDTISVVGAMTTSQPIIEKGKLHEVMRFPVYGIGGDLQFQTDSTTFEDLVNHYFTFSNGGSSALPAVPSGATRRFKLLVSYSTVGATSPATLRIIQQGTSTELASFALPTVNGLATGMVRTLLTPEFTTSNTNHTTFQAKADNASTSLVVKYIEVIAYDYYA
jgi:hypothetical protein